MIDPIGRRFVLAIMFGLATFQPAVSSVSPQVKISNTYTSVGNNRYDWTVFVKEDKATLNEIKCVEYTLHPTFPNPVRRVCKAEDGFALRENGWGEFTILIKVEWQDKHVTQQAYSLDLHSPELGTASPQDQTIQVGNTSSDLGNGQWSWTVFVIADKETLDGIRCVEYTLHPTFPQPIQRICQAGNLLGQAFPLTETGWGTFDIAVKILFRNGRSRLLTHSLKFDESLHQAPQK
jgi:transcription initiation factor IIF auxiliary subunit